ncbi:bifunctional diguanylate cyclase/phosphodiesterase [Pseudoxanthomonas indica]|uniref:PAS domain S-box-containing protein n=1 Tax=Pseudoxanthomonas indica TaxID=428993 RepID=A0A1T5ISM3_9GAMM|nr:EAL domain-containing protein [Pseudoxanthomonas indica]SKC42187.1 PAS domain S-box-containing protein [Pseudoxanthomonas indica]
MASTRKDLPVIRSSKAVAWSGLLLALALAYVLGYFIQRDRNVRMAAAERQALALAEGTARLLHLELRNLERAMGGIAGDAQQLFATVPEAAPQLLSESVAGVVSRHAELQSIVVVDRNGVAITRGVGVSIPDDARRSTPRGGKRPLSFGRLQRADGEWVLPLLMPMDGGRWIVTRLRVAEIQRVIGNLDTGKEGVVTVVDAQGTVVARSDGAGRYIGKRYADLLGASDSARVIVRRSAVDGVERISARLALPEYRLQVSAGLGTHETLHDWYLLLAVAGSLYLLYCAAFLYLWRHLRRSARAQGGLLLEVNRAAERLRLAQQVGKTGTWSVRHPGAEIEWSEQVSDIMGQPDDRSRASSEEFFAMVHPDDREQLQQRFAESWRTRQAFVTDYRIIRPDGEVRWIASRGGAFVRGDADPTMAGTVVDITAEREAQSRLLDTERRYRLLFERNPLPFWVFDAQTLRFLEVNEAAVRHYGYRREEFLAMSILDIRPDEDSQAVRLSMFGVPSDEGETWRHVKKDGSVIDVRVYSASITYDDRPARLVLAEDISDTLAYERELHYRATHDSTIGLFNLPGLKAWVRQQAPTQCQLIYIQLRGIEPVIDSLGQAVATRLLDSIASRLEDLAAQWQGAIAFVPAEAFVLAVPGTPAMEGVVDALHLAVTQPVEQGGSVRTLEAWLGWAECAEEGFDATASKAALAAHVARAEGTVCRHFRADMATAASDRLRLIGRIHQALERQEFELHFQPITRVDEARPASLEALLRWPQAGGGFVPPSQFIALSEDAGLILPLGEWVMEEAMRCQQRLAREGWDDLPIAINVSPLQLARPDFADRLIRLQQRHGLPRGALHIEVTESVLLDRPDRTVQTLRQLQRNGICTSLDDFGTGFSSMAYLHQLPLDALKIDQTFVRGVTDDERSAAICRALISLGHNLGLTMIAEGVETEQQLEWLRRHHCDQVQGYLIARPMKMDALLDYLAGIPLRNAH